eukprot:5662957-Pyramimonas_sp.AAC.1
MAKETWSTTIPLRPPRRMAGKAGMALSQLYRIAPKGVRSSSDWAIEIFKYNAAMQGIHYTLKHSWPEKLAPTALHYAQC